MRTHEILWMVSRLWDGAHIEFAPMLAVIHLPPSTVIARDQLDDLLDQADTGDWWIAVVDGSLCVRLCVGCAVTGIRELFAELSGGDEFEQQWQLELWGWRQGPGRREAWRDQKRATSQARTRHVHLCSKCGEEGHRGMWRGAVICPNAATRLAA